MFLTILNVSKPIRTCLARIDWSLDCHWVVALVPDFAGQVCHWLGSLVGHCGRGKKVLISEGGNCNKHQNYSNIITRLAPTNQCLSMGWSMHPLTDSYSTGKSGSEVSQLMNELTFIEQDNRHLLTRFDRQKVAELYDKILFPVAEATLYIC